MRFNILINEVLDHLNNCLAHDRDAITYLMASAVFCNRQLPEAMGIACSTAPREWDKQQMEISVLALINSLFGCKDAIKAIKGDGDKIIRFEVNDGTR